MAAVQQDLTVAIKLNDQFSKGIKSVGTNAKSALGSGVDGLGGLAASAGKAFIAAGALIGTSIVAGLGAAVSKAADFEQGMARVSALSGASAEELVKLNDKALELAGQTVFKGTEVAAGMEALAMAGLNVNEVLVTMPGLLSTATAGNTDLQATADIVTNVMSGFGLDATETQRIADVLAATFTSSNTTMNSLGETLKYVAPLASTAGLDLESMAAASGILGNVGISGSQAGTSLRGMIDGLIAPTSKAQEHLDALDITLTDMGGNLLPLPELVEELQGGMDGLDPSEQVRVLKDLVGVEAMGGLQALMAAGPEEIRKYSDELKNSLGKSAEIAKKSADNLKGAWNGLTSAFDSILIRIGMELTPVFQSLLNETITPLVRAVGEFAEKMGGFDVIFKDALTFIVGFKNTALNILSELFNNPAFAEEFLGNIGGIFQAALGVVTTFAFGTTGRGGMVGILTELGMIVWAPLKQGFLAIWDAIKIPLANGINWMQQIFTSGINGIIREFNSLSKYIGFTIDEIDFTPITVEAPKTFQERWAEGTKEVSESWDRIGEHAEDLQTGISAEMDNVTAAMAVTADTASHLVDEGMKEVVEKYEGAVETIKAEAKPDGEAIGGELAVGAEDAFDPKLEIDGSNIKLGDRNSWKSMMGDLPLADIIGEKFGAVFDQNGAVGQAIVGGLKNITEGQGFGEAVAGAAQGIGMAIGGPIGLAITTVATGVLGALAPASLVERKKFGGVAEEVAFAVEMGGIGKFSLSTEKGRDLAKQQRKYVREGTASKITRERSFAATLQEQFGKDREGEFYLGFADAVKLAAGMLSNEFYGEQGAELTNMIRDVIVRSTADKLREDKKRGQFRESVGEEAREMAGIAAANGYSGMVSEPTLFLAGEAGPEMVDITPSSRMSGGFSGSGGSNFHFNFSVNTIDEQGVRSFIERDAKPFIVQMLNRESTRGSTVMYSTGLTTDPSV